MESPHFAGSMRAVTKLRFDINPGADVAGLQHAWVLLANGSKVPKLADYLPPNPAPNTWNHVVIPLADLNSANLPYFGVYFQTDVDAPVTFHLDNVTF